MPWGLVGAVAAAAVPAVLATAAEKGLGEKGLYMGEDLPGLLPEDFFNKELVENVHPPDWVNPEPAGRYNLVVVGAGTAGLVTAAGAAGLGAKVALVEKNLLGGDCLNVGCVPSKTIISSSRISEEVTGAAEFGINVTCGAEVDFPGVMERMRRLRARISAHDSASRFKELGVDVYLGAGRFTGRDSLEVGGKTLRFKSAVVATGAHPLRIPIPGLAEAGYLTNESVFSLTERPARLAVLGGGAIGCELAQAFARLGSEVTVLQKAARLMDREDKDAAAIIQDAFAREGIRVVYGEWTLKEVSLEAPKDGARLLHLEKESGEKDTVRADAILVAVGRVPNVRGLGLEEAGVEFDERRGVVVDDMLRTTNPRIFAAGDVCLKFKFTHTAAAAARIVIENALFMGRKRFTDLTVPWCTFTDPEIAHVGMYEDEARGKGIEVDTFTKPLSEVDRAVLEGREDGFVKVHVQKGTDKLVGATVVASHAGEMIGELALAMSQGIGLKAISGVVHPYPTVADAIKQVADEYNRTRLTPGLKKWLARWLSLTR